MTDVVMDVSAAPDAAGKRRRAEPFPDLVRRLSAQSVSKRYDAFEDVLWDAPANRIDPDDPRWELPDVEPLSHTAWYRAQPPAVRTRLGLHLAASFMKVGIQFESVLKRGLLEFALTLPNGAPEFRYAYHEVAEETQHSLMFQEFVNRSGYDPKGVPAWRLRLGRAMANNARTFPELFFFAVLAGEEPIDHIQRSLLRERREMAPVLERVMRIHVIEEARHLCFARQYLREQVPRLSRARLLAVQLRVPILLRLLSQLMLRPSPDVAELHGIPRDALREAYSFSNERHARRTLEAVAKTRELCEELCVLSPRIAPLWRKLGLL